MIYSKKDMVSIIHNAAKIYDIELCQKNRLIIFGAPNAPMYIQTKANERNFHHLTGVISNINDNDALTIFYTRAKNKKLSVDDFEINPDGTTQLKMEIINQALNISKNAKMIGDFNNGHFKLKTDKIAGGIKSCIGFVDSDGFYVPNTILNDDIRKNTTGNQRILSILSKNANEKQYNKVDYTAKKIDVIDLLRKISDKVPIDPTLLQDEHSAEKDTAAFLAKCHQMEEWSSKLDKKIEQEHGIKKEVPETNHGSR